jgi:transposase InsO family protein
MIARSRSLFDELPVERACALLSVSRSEYYQDQRPLVGPGGPTWEQRLREAIEAIVLEWPRYGYRRVTAQLQREGWEVNHKRVLRLMQAEGWLCRRRRRGVRTTDSAHGLGAYPNLLANRGWQRLTAPNQAWVADLTYIRLPREFCYLAIVLDAFSRRVVGWNLAQSLEGRFALLALETALIERQPAAGWIHHSDRGVQYASDAYVARVQAAAGRLSMAAVGAPRENAQAESFMRTLKDEAVYLAEYATFQDALAGIGPFIDEVYNQKRLHSALGYRPPSEFEELFAAGVLH